MLPVPVDAPRPPGRRRAAGGDWPDVDQAKQTYFDTLHYARATLGINTSAMIESAIVDIPCVTIIDERYRGWQTDMGHFWHLMKGDFLDVQYSYDDAVSALAAILQGQTPATETPARAFGVLIAGGRIVDGTGGPWYRADIGIAGDRIAAIGDLTDATAKTRIDAATLVVAPGFIDMLGQSELNVLVDNRVESKVRQGITTEVTGEGGSVAPMNDVWIAEARPWLDKYRLTIDWTDLEGYWRRLREKGSAINFVW